MADRDQIIFNDILYLRSLTAQIIRQANRRFCITMSADCYDSDGVSRLDSCCLLNSPSLATCIDQVTLSGVCTKRCVGHV
ncbi:hypothetical protein M3J09_003528 [Ascochyta lentis]